VLTSSDQQRDRELSRSLGTDGYLVKPASIASLIDELRQHSHLLFPSDGSSAR
jgi:DNA-binding response OmpR family regulator